MWIPVATHLYSWQCWGTQLSNYSDVIGYLLNNYVIMYVWCVNIIISVCISFLQHYFSLVTTFFSQHNILQKKSFV